MSKAKDLQQLIKTLVGSNPSPAQKKSYYFSFAFKLYEAGEKADAKNYLEEYLAIKTQDVKGYNLLGQIYEELNSPNDAIKAYNRSLSIDDSQIRLMLKLSSLYLQVKNITEANFWLDRAETKANNDEKAEIVQNRIEILKLSNGSRVFEQAAAGLVHYPKHLGINIQYLEALEARESYFSIFQHFEKCNRYFETNIRWWEWGLHFLSRLIQKHKDKQQDDAMDEDSEQTVQMHEIVLAWMHFADRYTKLFIDSNFYTLSMTKCKEFEDLVISARENPPAQLDEDDAQYWNYAIEEYAARVDQHYASTFIREAGQTTSSEEQTNALREAFLRLNKCFNNFPAESKMSTLQRRSEVGKQLWSLINTHKAHLDEDHLAVFDVDGLLNSTKGLDLQVLNSTPEYADNIDSVLRVCGFYNENKLHNIIEEIFNSLFGADLPKIDANIYREMSSPHVVDFMTYFYVTLLTPATNANDPLWRDSRKAIRILSSKKKLDGPWTKHEDLPSITSIAHWIDKIRIGPSDNPLLYFLTKLYSDRCIDPENELQKEFAPVYEKYTINLGKKLVKQLRQLLETRVSNSIVQSDKQAMLDDTRNILETLAKRALKINDYTKAMTCVNNLGTSSSYLLLIELSLSQYQSSQRKEFLQRAEQYLKRSSDFSFTKGDEQKKLEQLRNELHALRGDPMELENTNLTPMTPGTPSMFDTQPFISPAVDMTPTATAKRRREQQLSDLKKLRSEALQLSSSKGSATPSTPTTPSMFGVPPKKHESPPPARKLDFSIGDMISTPETKPPSQSNLIVSINVGNNVPKTTPVTPAATLPTPSKLQFITPPTAVPVVSTPTRPSIPATIKTDVPIPAAPQGVYKDNREDDDGEESKPKKKRQLSDTDLDPQKKASLISSTTNFPPIPTKIVSPNAVVKASPTKPSRSEVLRNAQAFDFGAPMAVTPATPSSGASPFSFGAPTTDTKSGSSSTPSPFGFGAPSTDKTPAFGFGAPLANASPFSFGPAPTVGTTDKPKDQPSAAASPFSFGPAPTSGTTDKPKDQPSSTASPFGFGVSKPEEKKSESTGTPVASPFGNFAAPGDKPTASPFSFGPPMTNATKPEEKKISITNLVDNNSPFNFDANKPSTAFGQSPTQSALLGSSVKSEMSASDLMKSDLSVESAGWREERGPHFGSERNELFKETVLSPESSQRSEGQDPSEEKSGETDSEHDEEDAEGEEEHEESEESYHSDDSDGWFTGPAPKKPLTGDAPVTSTPTKSEKPKAQPITEPPKPQFGFENNTPSFGVQDKLIAPKDLSKPAEVPSISFGSPTNKAKEEKKVDSPVFSFSPRQLDKAEEKKPENGFGFGFGAPTFSFGEKKDQTPIPPAASPKLSFESFTPKLEAEQPGDDFNGVPAFSLGGKLTDSKPAETKPEETKSEEKPSTGLSFGFGTPGAAPFSQPAFNFGFGAPDKKDEKKSEPGFGFGNTSAFSFGQSAKPEETKSETKTETNANEPTNEEEPEETSPQETKSESDHESEEASEEEEGDEKPEPSASFDQPADTTTEKKPDEETKPEEKKPEPSTGLSFGFGTPSFGVPTFSFGQPAESKPEEPKDEAKTEEKKPETGLGFGFGTPSFGTPSFSFGQPEATKKEEDKPKGEDEEAVKEEEKPKDETKPDEKQEEAKPEEKKTETPTGFGFGTPLFGAPSFSFGQSETKKEEPKQAEKAETASETEPENTSNEESKPETKSDEPKGESEKPKEPVNNEQPKFDLSAMGADTFKFGGQTEETKPETAAPQPSFSFSFGGGLLEKDKAAQQKPSKHLKDPMKPIPDDSDDDDSDSDDDAPSKPKSTSTSNTQVSSFTLAPSSFSFAPSSFSVPASDAPKAEEPKFDFTIQFGEASMTKRLGSDFGLSDNNNAQQMAANTNTNLSGSGSSFSFGSSDKIFGQASAAPLTTFSALTKSDDTKQAEEKKEDDKREPDVPKPEEQEEKSEQSETKDDQDKPEETSVNDSVASEAEESKSANQSIDASVSESVNTTVEASHDEGSDSDPASASEDETTEGDSNITEALDEQHTATLSHFQRASGPKNRRKPSHPPAVEKKEAEIEVEEQPTDRSVEDEPKDESEDSSREASPAKPKVGFGFALPGMAPGVDLRSMLKKTSQPKDDEPKESTEEKDEASNTNQQVEPAEEQESDSVKAAESEQGEEKSPLEDSAVESVPSDVPSLVSDSHVEDSLNKDVSGSVRSEDAQSELSVSVLEGSNLSVESTGWNQAERGSHFGSEHDNPLFAATIMSPPESIASSQIDEPKNDEKPAEAAEQSEASKPEAGSVVETSEEKAGSVEEKPEDKPVVEESADTKDENKSEEMVQETPQEETNAEEKPTPEEKKEEPKTFAFNFPSPTETPAPAPKEKLSFDFTGVNTPSFGFGAPKDSSTAETGGFGLGFSNAPSFSFGKAAENNKPEEKMSEEKKPETGFGFGFGAPSFGAPSFSFGQSETKKEEPKQAEKAEEKAFDLSAMGTATFKFGGQTEEKKPESATPSFNFGFGNTATNTASPFSLNFGSALGAPATQQPKQSTQAKPQKKGHNPIPGDSDDDDSDSDDDVPSKSKGTSTSSSAFTMAPSSFSFAPSSFSVPASDAPKAEEPKFDFTIQFGEASMTKRLGSDFGLSDNNSAQTMGAANTNLSGSGSSFSFGSSDKIFGQTGTSSLTTFSSLNKSEDKEKNDQDKKEDEQKPDE